MNNPTDELYESKRKKISNVLKNSNLGVSRVTPAGSRAKQQHRPDSDQDIIFAVFKDPSREEFYPELIKTLEKNYPEAKISEGSNKNVIHLELKKNDKFDLVLLSEQEFDKEHKDIKDYKRNNL